MSTLSRMWNFIIHSDMQHGFSVAILISCICLNLIKTSKRFDIYFLFTIKTHETPSWFPNILQHICEWAFVSIIRHWFQQQAVHPSTFYTYLQIVGSLGASPGCHKMRAGYSPSEQCNIITYPYRIFQSYNWNYSLSLATPQVVQSFAQFLFYLFKVI